jgi:hypothetical protein
MSSKEEIEDYNKSYEKRKELKPIFRANDAQESTNSNVKCDSDVFKSPEEHALPKKISYDGELRDEYNSNVFNYSNERLYEIDKHLTNIMNKLISSKIIFVDDLHAHIRLPLIVKKKVSLYALIEVIGYDNVFTEEMTEEENQWLRCFIDNKSSHTRNYERVVEQYIYHDEIFAKKKEILDKLTKEEKEFLEKHVFRNEHR